MNNKPPYTRKIKQAPYTPVKNGKAIFGSFYGCFKKFDIRGLYGPFGNLPLPTFISDMRIADAMRFMFCNDDVIGEVSVYSCYLFSMMETSFWLRGNNEKYAYRQYLPARFIHLPKHIQYSITACRKRHRYARIFSRLSHGKLHIDLDFLARDTRPSCEARLDLDINNSEALDFTAVLPYFVSRRCQAIYLQTGLVKGWISLAYKPDILLEEENSVGLIDMRKAYIGYKTKMSLVCGLGKIDNKNLVFRISNSVAPDAYKYNENVLLYEAKRTPLPPVQITRPFGLMGKWIIQDTEGMVDLVFNPISKNHKKVNAVIFRSEYNTIYGCFDGMLLDADGKEIKLKSFPGIIKKYNLRV